MTPAPDRASPTIEAARRELGRRFRDAGIDSPELDARLLVGAVLGLDLTALVAQSQAMLPHDAATQIAVLAERRLAGEPVARILGEKEFWGLRFRLSSDTLVPRPDTETVIAAALDFVRMMDADKPLRILDVGTGSGAILLALLSELTDASGIGTDIAPGALTTAKQNADALGLSARAEFAVSDYFSAVSGTFGIIISNPPYIRTADIESLSTEVRSHEPYCALDGGVDGLAAYRTLCAQSPAHLRPGGALIVEVGHGQAEAVAGLMQATGLNVVKPFRGDLAGVPRVVEGHK